ncbi:MAG: Na+/H+ antiporter NhaC [Bacteroidales bacterium]|nr:Na+/H+ antiporter NhaC [Bacteroidales bacterium]
MTRLKRPPTLLEALIPVVFLTALISINVFIFGDDSLAGSNQMVLVLSATVAAIVAFISGTSWEELHGGIVKSIGSAMSAILILLLIGSLAGTWLLSGIVPAMIYYGLQILNPTIFLLAACIVSSIVSLATGSSWSTVATLGVALLGIGRALGLPDGVIGGAILSGAYFGDKMSPLSDTTNLAPAMAGTDLFTHIRYMVLTTAPTFTITLIIYLVIGFSRTQSTEINDIQPILSAINGTFNVTPLLFIVPVMVISLIVMKIPALPALLSGTLAGALFALIFQPQIIEQVSGIEGKFHVAAYVAIMKSMYTSISVTTDHEMVNSLLSTGGMRGMLNTVWLIICAMVFGGIMEAGGLLQRITQTVIRWANSQGSLIASTAGTCIFFNITASDQYLSIVVPGRMFASTYRERGLAPQNLSRTLEDSGTVTSVLVPWNTCGATQSVVLGIPTLTYLPYCFFNLISPLMTIFFGYMNIKIAKLSDQVFVRKDQ